MEHYENKSLHCYEENSQGPCEVGKVFVLPDEEDETGSLEDEQNRLHCYEEKCQGWTDEDGNLFIERDEDDQNCGENFVIRELLGRNGFRIKCKRGSKPDARGKCKPTHTHGKNRPRRSCDVKCLRDRRKNQQRRTG